MRDRKAGRHRRPLQAQLAAGAQSDLELVLPVRVALREQLVDPELLERDDLELRRVLAHARDLEGVQDRHPAIPLFRVEEGVRDRDRHLVPKLG